LRFYLEELEGLFESLLDYYRSLTRLEGRLRGIAGVEAGEGFLEVVRWRMAIARLLAEHRRLIESIREGSLLKARGEACVVNDIALKLIRSAPDPSLSLHAIPLLAGIYELSRHICELQGS